MVSEKTHFHHLIIEIVAIWAMATLSTSLGKVLEGCPETCGNLTIPYPFGTREGCYYNDTFLITCNTTASPPTPLLRNGNIVVTNISINEGEITVLSNLASDCYYQNGTKVHNVKSSIKFSHFKVSNRRNKFTVVGCDTYAEIIGYQGSQPYKSGCTTSCFTTANVISGSCTGVGCCQTSLPTGVDYYEVNMYSTDNHTAVWNISSCGYGFVVRDTYNFSVNDLSGLIDIEELPIVLDWTIGNETCEATRNSKTNICGNNTKCLDSDNGPGYRCNCEDGYEGNPYFPFNCTDINECRDPNLNQCVVDGHGLCSDKPAGNYTCSCYEGYNGDGRKDGDGCMRIVDQSLGIKIVVGIVATGTSLLVGFTWVYLAWKKRKLIMLKEKFFQQNGGLMLKERQKFKEIMKFYSAEELEKATNFYAGGNIIGKGGNGIVYRGILESKEVAIKRSKILDTIKDTNHASQVEELINEVIVLSQIHHLNNVVTLFGCCLEKQVPLLVYEFVPKGSLYDNIHNRDINSRITWEITLRIASEIAMVLSYLHTLTVPIIHGDIKSANILLDNDYTAKLCDFGASKMVPLDETQIITVIKGTTGYLDPEYMHTAQLTDKSDVYSFGVVLVEMLTKRKVLSFQKPENEIVLAKYFVSSLKEGRLLEILNARMVNDASDHVKLERIADLAKRCLSVKGEDRPSMADVFAELQGLKSKAKHARVSDDHEDIDNFYSIPLEMD